MHVRCAWWCHWWWSYDTEECCHHRRCHTWYVYLMCAAYLLYVRNALHTTTTRRRRMLLKKKAGSHTQTHSHVARTHEGQSAECHTPSAWSWQSIRGCGIREASVKASCGRDAANNHQQAHNSTPSHHKHITNDTQHNTNCTPEHW